jgi:hypothetical protein
VSALLDWLVNKPPTHSAGVLRAAGRWVMLIAWRLLPVNDDEKTKMEAGLRFHYEISA